MKADKGVNTPNVKKICAAALFAALTAALSPLSLPTPLGVPLTFQTLAIALTGFLLSPGASVASVLCYILLGTAGLPVFSGFSGGAAVLTGPTGGFIFAFPVFVLILSFVFYVNKPIWRVLLCAAALAVLYAAGVAQFGIVSGSAPAVAAVAFVPYLVKDAAVVLFAYFFCVRVRPKVWKFIQSQR